MNKLINMSKVILTIGLFFVLFCLTNVSAETAIEEVTINGLKEPVVGETVADNLANVTVPEGANYSIVEVVWWGSEDGMYYYDMADDYAFEEGIYYYCSVSLMADDGFDFPYDTETYDYTGTVTTNEMPYVAAQQYDEGTLDIFGDIYYFSSEEETPAEPVSNEIAPPNTGITIQTTTDNNSIIIASIICLSVIGIYIKKKLFN